MVQQVKMLATKSKDQSSNLETNTMEGEYRPHKLSSDFYTRVKSW